MTDLATTLAALEDRLTPSWPASPTNARSRSCASRFLGRSGEVTAMRRGIGALPPAERPDRGQGDQRGGRARWKRRSPSRSTRSNARALEDAAGRVDRRHVSRPPARIGSIHPIRRVIERHRPLLHAARLRGRARPRDRNRREQLRRAQHSARSSGARRARFVLPAPRSACCARTPRRCKCARCANPGRRSRSSSRAKRIAAMPSTRATSTSSIKSKA